MSGTPQYDDRDQDTEHAGAGHMPPELALDSTLIGTFDNQFVENGFQTDFDYVWLDLSNVHGGSLTLRFSPSSDNVSDEHPDPAYFFRITARIDERSTVLTPSPQNPNSTWMVLDPIIPLNINGDGTVTIQIADLKLDRFSDPIIEFQLRGGDEPDGDFPYTPLDYTLQFDYTPGVHGPSEQPDFTATIDTVSATVVQPGAGIDVRFSWDTLGGSSHHAHKTIGLYLSTDAHVTTSDRLLFSDSGVRSWFDGPAGRTVHVTIPSNLAAGTYYLSEIVDSHDQVDESDETNNVSAPVAITVFRPGVDLGTRTLTVNDTTLQQGSGLTISGTAANYGDEGSGGGQIAYFLSKDKKITKADKLLGVSDFGPIGANGTVAFNFDAQVPAHLKPGKYYVGTIIDYGTVIFEFNEKNNAAAWTKVSVASPQGVDLTDAITSLSTTNVASGGSLKLHHTLSNSGSKASGAGAVNYYLSTDATITASDTLLGTGSFASVKAHGAANIAKSLVLPMGLDPGTYYVGVIADPSDAILETNNTNNTSPAVAITVGEATGIDLAPSIHVSGATTIEPRGTVSLSYNIDNTGTVDSPIPKVGIYLSTDPTITTSDRLLDFNPAFAGVFAGGSISSGRMDLRLPAKLAFGTYYIGVIIDPKHALHEGDNTNNTSSGVAITIGNVPADDFAADFFTSGRIDVNGFVTGVIETTDDRDGFHVALSGGVTYTFMLQGWSTEDAGTLLDPVLRLYDRDGFFLDYNDDGGEGTDAQIVFTPDPDAGGTYFLEAAGFVAVGSYTLRVTPAPLTPASLPPTTGDGGDNVLPASSYADRFKGFGGDDFASYAAAPAGVHASLADPSSNTGWAETDSYDAVEGLIGSRFADILAGDGANNFLNGGRGKDVLTGGGGADHFVFGAVVDSKPGAKRDIITDFNSGAGDKIDLSAIDADTRRSPGDDEFTFIGTHKFTGVDGQLRCKGGIIQGDVNGDKIADFEIKVNLATLTQGDFIL